MKPRLPEEGPQERGEVDEEDRSPGTGRGSSGRSQRLVGTGEGHLFADGHGQPRGQHLLIRGDGGILAVVSEPVPDGLVKRCQDAVMREVYSV